MVVKTECDVCGKEIVPTFAMSHNEAAQTYHGEFLYASGVMLDKTDLCGSCALKVKEFIEGLKGGEKHG